MNYPSLSCALLLLLAYPVVAGESALTTTFQPLDGLGAGGIVIAPVVCHDWSSHSGQATAIGLISARNVPPTNNPKQATQDLNFASRCNVSFRSSDIGDPRAPLELTMDLSTFTTPAGYAALREDIIRACLECLRRCLPEKLRAIPVTLVAADKDRPWLTPIIKAFNDQDRALPFYVSE